MTRALRSLATYVVFAVGILGILALLFAWNFPPFNFADTRTDDAYIRGQVTRLSPQLSAIVADVPVQDFQKVKKGDLLVQLDDRIYSRQLAEADAAVRVASNALESNMQAQETAKAQIEAASADVASAEAVLANATSQWERIHKLSKKQVASESSLETSRATLDQAKASLAKANAALDVARQSLKSTIIDRETLKARLASAEAARTLARINLENTRIIAPRDGTLGQVQVHSGQYVSAGSQLVSLVPQNVWVIANYKETQLPGMRVGQKVSFTVDALDGERFSGHIERFSPAAGSEFAVIKADNATGNFTKVSQRVPVRIAIDPDQKDMDKLIPGLSVVATVETEKG
ncbi:HlyD family secretion protein [Martelella lutilitoris]|uniref:HlyD family secretion protein n=1 Tax=Martelella lutilitoris TaxID=2583532 RepID=A0A5C4JV41_9HYPH|nr:HlyD family secretion protein [Martelella lutilitoris]TNB49120.1 HlyD family secretion protein [Martelella lutilitoris]